MDYKAALKKDKGKKLLHTNQDPFQGHQITQEDNQQRITPGSTLGLSSHGTNTQQEANLMGKSQGTQSLDTKPQATHLASKTTLLLETQLSTPGNAGCKLDADAEDDGEEDMGELNTRLACLRDTSCSGGQFCQRPAKQHLCTPNEVKTGPPAKPESTDNLCVKDSLTKIEHTNQDPFQGHQMDKHLCTPKGDNVLWQDVLGERNPYAEACQDSSDLLGIIPGHYNLQANNTADVLCALVQTDLHSQFYKSDPASETKVPGYSLGKDRVTKKSGALRYTPPSLRGKEKRGERRK